MGLENKVIHGDCLEEMKNIRDKSIDMILCDLPYGTTDCNWDIIIPLDLLWEQYKRIIKEYGVIVLTADYPFSYQLISSNIEQYKYQWIWKKNIATGFFNIKRRPLKIYEDILIFSSKKPVFNPQMRKGFKPYITNRKGGKYSEIYQKSRTFTTVGTNERYPINILNFKSDKTKLHSTQKPIALFEYLIKTYTNEGDLVLDNCAGSGTTAIACKNTNRNYILIEKEKRYFDICNDRIRKYNENLYLFK